ncbi:iron chelate uptake ABC transporter family permease subunit [Amaricoccus sp.]
MTLGAKGSWSFLLPFRGLRLAALALVGAAVGVATVLFQTVTGNRILTPSIMGFDALYVLLQTALVFLLGGLGYAMLDARPKFLAETGLMMLASASLLGLLLGRGRHDLHRMLLVGVIFGTLFRSLAAFLQRLMDPNAFAVLQGASFASFGSVETDLLALAALLAGAGGAATWRLRHALDVVALGRAPAIGLGVGYDAIGRFTLLIVALLVSVSTALVGPVAFFGLIVASLAHLVVRSPHHAHLLPAAALIGATILVAGQTLFERVLGLQSTLSVVIEFAGGLLFLALLLRARPT